MKNWKEDKTNYIEWFYGRAYRQFKAEGAHDDRIVYVNTYEMIMKALNSLRKNPDLYVRVAMNKEIEKDLETLREIGKEFGLNDYIFREEA